MSEFVKDPSNPTDAEISAAIERGLADGTLIDAAEWLAANAPTEGTTTSGMIIQQSF